MQSEVPVAATVEGGTRGRSHAAVKVSAEMRWSVKIMIGTPKLVMIESADERGGRVSMRVSRGREREKRKLLSPRAIHQSTTAVSRVFKPYS